MAGCSRAHLGNAGSDGSGDPARRPRRVAGADAGRHPALVGALLLVSAFAGLGAAAAAAPHPADASPPRLWLLEPAPTTAEMPPADRLAAAQAFLRAHARDFGHDPDLAGIVPVGAQESLLGTTFRFRQELGGHPVAGAEITVSLDPVGRAYRVFSSLRPVRAAGMASTAAPTVDRAAAIAAAWQALGGRALLSLPATRLAYVPDGVGGLALAYEVDLYLERMSAAGERRPGLWQVRVDAATGRLLGEPLRLSTEGGARTGEGVYDPEAGDLAAALREAAERGARERAAPAAAGTTVAGSAFVFDPDPATTLRDPTLTDTSPASRFLAAYSRVTLLGLTRHDGAVHLVGPWVRLGDFEPPVDAPSTTPDGIWRARRGDSAFDDAMAYFHIDRNQRYVQSLGYRGDRGIQQGPILVDSNGLRGLDTSHYLRPPLNRIAFGHGCVDDPEDADVILHEYGHAITFAIAPHWGVDRDGDGESDGDSGAIGEGFGDYWAESYSHETRNGATFQVDKVFDWDANHCPPWRGRRLDVSGPAYDPARHYHDHEPIGGGTLSDELWSTPLYQSFRQLRRLGVPKRDVDKVILESMFGLVPGFTMRHLAQTTVASARRLFPAGPHAAIFTAQFRRLDILPR